MPNVYVTLDEAGHVAGVISCEGSPPPGWMFAPPNVASAAFNYRLCPKQGWVRKTREECREFHQRHAPPTPPPDRSEMAKAALRHHLHAGRSLDTPEGRRLLIDAILS